MTSKICGSGQFYQWEVFKVVRIDRLKKNTLTYVFVGEQSKEVKNILYDLENGKKLGVKDDKKLKDVFKNQYNHLIKHKTSKVKYIYRTAKDARRRLYRVLKHNGWTDERIERMQCNFKKIL